MAQLGALTARRDVHARAGIVLPASLEQALHRCIVLASRFGTVLMTKPTQPDRREFFLELDEAFAPRMLWTLKWMGDGTQLTIGRPTALARLTNFARRGASADRQLDRKLRMLPLVASLKIAVIGGGTGLYTTLLGLRDRTWSLTAIISGLPRAALARDPKDHLGALPRDDASISLVGLTPTLEENVVLRSLLSHQMESSDWRGAHFGAALLHALEEIRGSRQAALDTAGELLGIRGRVVLAMDEDRRPGKAGGAVAALSEAEMIVIAPGHLELDLLPVLCCPGIIEAVQQSQALKLVVTKIMTAEDSDEVPLTSKQVAAVADLTGVTFDVALANSGSFSPGQLRLYAAAGARPVRPDVEATTRYARRVVTEQLSALGDLARHDPERLGEFLVEIGAEHLLTAREAETASA